MRRSRELSLGRNNSQEITWERGGRKENRKGSDRGWDQGSRRSWKPKEKILKWEILQCKYNGWFMLRFDRKQQDSAMHYPSIKNKLIKNVNLQCKILNAKSSQYFCNKVHACSVVSDSLQPCGLKPARLLCPWNSPGKNTGVSCHSFLQGIFLTQGSNPHLLHLPHWQEDSLPLTNKRNGSYLLKRKKPGHDESSARHLGGRLDPLQIQ